MPHIFLYLVPCILCRGNGINQIFAVLKSHSKKVNQRKEEVKVISPLVVPRSSCLNTSLTMTVSGKYPAKAHALNVYNHFKTHSKITSPVGFFLSGESYEFWEYSDQTKPIRQNRYFFYLSGVSIPGSHVFYDSESDSLTLFLPEVDEEDVMWSGLPLSVEEAKSKYNVDHVKYSDKIEKELSSFKGKKIYTTSLNKNNEKYSSLLTADDKSFFYALDESRLIKDSYEIELMRKAAKLTDNCHLAVMSALPIEHNESHIHAEFMYHALRQGSKYQSYDPICCSGENCSTLHYVKNDEDIAPTRRSVLIDAGCEWECYASDVTRCFPINGEWTKEHLEIYKLVLKMQSSASETAKPGALWEDLHLHAHKVLIEGFLELGIFKSEYTVEELFKAKVSARFFPHGLGHLLGMDTHDVGGYPKYDDPDPLLQYLRMRRTLQAGMVITNEPGCYFNPFLLDEVLNGELIKYINKDVLDKYWYIGGVRIEDDLLITEDGYENLTGITSDPEEISKIIKKGLERAAADGFHNVV